MKRSWLISAVIFAVIIIIKLIGAAINPIALDEPFTLFYANSDLSFLNEMMESENNPPTHFYLMHYWIKLFGHSIYLLRLPGIIAIAATGVLIYQIAKENRNQYVGFLAVGLFVLSNYITVFAHEVRAYPFLILFTAASLYAMQRTIKSPTYRNWILWGVMNSMMLYFHFIGVVWWMAQGVSIVILYRDHIVPLVKSNALSAILSIPIFIHLYNRFTDVNENGTWINDTGSFDGVYNQIWKFSNSPVAAVLFISIIVLGGVVMFKRKESFTKEYVNYLLLFLLPIVFIVAFSQIKPIFLDRYMVFVSIPFFLLIISSIYSLDKVFKNGKVIIGTLAILVMLINFKLSVDNQRNLPEIANHVREFNRDEQHITLISPAWMDIRIGFHLDEKAFWNWENFTESMIKKRVYAIGDSSKMPSLQAVDGVLLIDGDMRLSDPNNTVRDILYKRYNTYRELKDYKGYTLLYFTNSH